jgi:hypothetical protein
MIAATKILSLCDNDTKPFADLDAIWGKGIINGDQFVQVVI